MFVKFKLYKFIKKCLSRVGRKIQLAGEKVPDKQYVFSLLERNFKDIIDKYNNPIVSKSTLSKDTCENIWVFWWQGEDKAPDVVKKCIASIRRNAGTHRVVVLSKDTYADYVDIPDYIVNKINTPSGGGLLLAHFSDILRMSLLEKWGGCWLDATIYVSGAISEDYFEHPFFTIHRFNGKIKLTNGKWTTYCMASKPGNELMGFLKEIFLAYFKQYNVIIDYFFLDYCIAYAYERMPILGQMIENVPFNNTNALMLMDYVNQPYNDAQLKSILKSGNLFKLTYKAEFNKDNDINYNYL